MVGIHRDVFSSDSPSDVSRSAHDSIVLAGDGKCFAVRKEGEKEGSE